jgi:hypothetical protein
MIRNIVAFLRFAPLAIALFVAVTGAFMALIGGLAGWETMLSLGKSAAGMGALGFFAWLLLPVLVRSF